MTGNSTGSYLTIGGVALVILGIIVFIAAAGFPPGFTTTYEYSSTGSVTNHTSPSDLQTVICGAMVILGAVLIRAGRVANS